MARPACLSHWPAGQPDSVQTSSLQDLIRICQKISSLPKQLPKVKHQLCYWHAIKYIEEWLGENQPPAAYNAPCAYNAFSFIDPTWVSGMTRGDIDEYLDGCDIE